MIWRYILHETLQKRARSFMQKDIAAKFHISTSTVFNALKMPRKMNAVEVTGRMFRVRDPEKLLLLWATHRNPEKDILYKTHSDLPIKKIEGMMPPDFIFGMFSAYRLVCGDAPADYDIVYGYCENPEAVKKRFPQQKGYQNIVVIKMDPLLREYGNATPDVQTFVDLWNLKEWYAKDYLEQLKKKLKI